MEEKLSYLWKIFNSLGNSFNIAIVNEIMENSTQEEINIYFQLLGKAFYSRSKVQTSDDFSFTFSLMSYFNIMMRYNPSLELWFDNVHFIILIYMVTFPYANFFITFVLVPLMLRNVDLDMRAFEKVDGKHGNSNYTIINYLEHISEEGSKHKEIFAKVPEQYSSAQAAFLFAKLNNQERQQEIVVLMDEPEFLFGIYQDTLKEESISMQSRRIYDKVVNEVSSCTHHMGINQDKLEDYHAALKYYNFYVFEKVHDCSDIIPEGFLEELRLNLDEVMGEYPKIKNFVMNILKKDVKACEHFFSSLPSTWREEALQTYRDSRMNIENLTALRNYSFQMGIQHLTLDDLKKNLTQMKEKLSSSSEILNNILVNMESQNKAYLKLLHNSSVDLFENDLNLEKLKFGNEESLMGDNIFLLNRHEIFSFRQGNFIYSFDYRGVENIMDSGINPYTREKLSEDLKYKAFLFLNRYGDWRKELAPKPLNEVFEDLVKVKPFKVNCGCMSNDPYKKLSYFLKYRGIDERTLRHIHIEDLVFKMSMMGYNLPRSSVPEKIFEILLELIEQSPPERKEIIKNHISGIINIQRVPIRMEMMGI